MEQSEKAKRKQTPQWYIWYVKPRAEKKVQERLSSKNIEVFLPLRKELRQWSDRKKWVELPLFPGYIFTYITDNEFESISFTEGVLTYLRFEGKPAVLRAEQVDEIKMLLTDPELLIIENQELAPGDHVEITAGPFRTMTGEAVEYRGNRRLAVRIELLGQVLIVQLPAAYVRRKLRA